MSEVLLRRRRGSDWPGRGWSSSAEDRLRAARPVPGRTNPHDTKLILVLAKSDFDLSTLELVKLDGSC